MGMILWTSFKYVKGFFGVHF